MGSFTPAYASLLLFGTIFGLEISDLPTLVFSASLVAIGLSAIQRGVLRFVLRPSSLVRNYARRSANEIIKETRATENEKVRKLISKTFSEEYGRRLSREIEEISYKESLLSQLEKTQMRSSESRVLLFLYLALVFGVSLTVGIGRFLISLTGIDLPIITAVTLEPSLIVSGSVLGLTAFSIGYKYEVTVYRQIVWRTIPVFTASDPQLAEGDNERKVEFVKKKLEASSSPVAKLAYREAIERLESDLKKAKQFAIEKEWLDNEVANATKMNPDEVRKISQSIAEKSVYAPRRFTRPFIAGARARALNLPPRNPSLGDSKKRGFDKGLPES
ncbi:MAG: hypothetical protein V3U49_08425 [Nitrososphaerales archaeon]